MSQRRRIGVMGGTFDPVHHGHLVAASEVASRFALDEVVFVPTGEPWQKTDRAVSAAEDRYLMTVIATASNPRFTVSRADIDRKGPTYTIDTLTEMRATYPDAELFFITGADALDQILSWHKAAEIFALAHFIGVTRPGYHRSAQSPWSRSPPWPSRPPAAVNEWRPANRSGTWCRTAWSSTSPSAACTATDGGHVPSRRRVSSRTAAATESSDRGGGMASANRRTPSSPWSR
jgi:nicotinate-nucleotide adenylyltransferase